MRAPDYKSMHPKTRSAWRKWLEKNHSSSPGVWLIYYKKDSGKRKLSYNDAVEEALCFGWIDSTARRLDAERSMQKFTPRKRGSAWSRLNKDRVSKLISEGAMTDAGMAKIKQAQKDGSWEKLTSMDTDASERAIPAALLNAFAKVLPRAAAKKALGNFKAFAPGYRKQFIFWINSARRPETTAARLKQTVLMAAANKKPGPKGFKL